MTQPVKSKIMLILINSNSERLSIQVYIYSFIFREETLKIQHSHFCLQENQYIRQRSAKCRIKYTWLKAIILHVSFMSKKNFY